MGVMQRHCLAERWHSLESFSKATAHPSLEMNCNGLVKLGLELMGEAKQRRGRAWKAMAKRGMEMMSNGKAGQSMESNGKAGHREAKQRHSET